MRDIPCAHCKKRPSEVQGGGEFPICSRCRLAHFCSPSCQKAAWAFHKGICKMHQMSMNHVERHSLSLPLSTGLIVSRSHALQTDIKPELMISLASAFRAQLLDSGGCLAETHAACLFFAFDRHGQTTREQFHLISGEIKTFEETAKPYLWNDPLLAFNLSPQGLRGWNPWISANDSDKQPSATVSCLITVMDRNTAHGFYNMIIPIHIHPMILAPAFDSRADMAFTKLALLEADDGWLKELKSNIEVPSNEWELMRAKHCIRRTGEFRTRAHREAIDEAMAQLGDCEDCDAVVGAYTILALIKLEDKPEDPNYDHWKQAMEKVKSLLGDALVEMELDEKAESEAQQD
ncbi:hypothetical protein RQP46_005785 [Phenoliferia psychrophenolica]